MFYTSFLSHSARCVIRFAHGANDTANATAAFSATLGTYQNGLDSCDQPETPVWICVEIKFRAPHAIDAMLSP